MAKNLGLFLKYLLCPPVPIVVSCSLWEFCARAFNNGKEYGIEGNAMEIGGCDDSREDRGALRALLEACGHDFEIREYGSGAELYADMG